MTTAVQDNRQADPDTPEPISDFIEQFGLVTEADGLPRNAGRIFGFLIVHGGPFSFSELATRLQISRGSVSTNTRLLEDMRVIVRTTRPGDRQDYFRLAPNPYKQFFERLAERSRRTRSLVEETCDALPEGWPDAKARLGDLSDFYRRLAEMSESTARDYGTTG